MSKTLFVTGRMRSGTTMLCSFLSSQRGIRLIADGLRVPTASLSAFKKRVNQSQSLHPKSKDKLWTTYLKMTSRNVNAPEAERAIVKRLMELDTAPEFDTHVELYQFLVAELQKEMGVPQAKPYFGTKATRGENLAIGLARQGAKSMIILRDPRAVYVSTALRARKDKGMRMELDQFIDEWRSSYKHWSGPSKKTLCFRYEDFLTENSVVEKMSEYLDHPLDPETQIATANSSFGDETTGKRRLEAIDRWRNFDDQASIGQIEEILKSEMEGAGYL